jgi:hypothetical protein
MKKIFFIFIFMAMATTLMIKPQANIDIRLDSPTAGGVLLASLGAYLVKNQQTITGIPTLVTGVAMATNNQDIIKSIFIIADNSLNAGYEIIVALYNKLASTYTAITTPTVRGRIKKY